MRLQILNDKSGPIALWAFWGLCVLVATLFWIVVFLRVAHAQAPLLPATAATIGFGTPCEAFWSAVTTDTNGGAITVDHYNVYVDVPTIMPGVTPPTGATTTLSWKVCAGAPALTAPGAPKVSAHTLAVSAVHATLGEGAASAPIPFTFINAQPGLVGTAAVTCANGVCAASWTPPTTNSDGTVPLVAPATAYRVFLDPVGVPAPGAAPTATVTALAWPIPATVAVGQHNLYIAAVAVGGVGPAFGPVPFAVNLAAPLAPSGVGVR